MKLWCFLGTRITRESEEDFPGRQCNCIPLHTYGCKWGGTKFSWHKIRIRASKSGSGTELMR